MPNEISDWAQQKVVTPLIPSDIQQILQRIQVNLPSSGRHLYVTGEGCQWLSPYNAQLFENFLTHHNVLVTDSRMCIQYLIKYAAGEEERAMVYAIAKSISALQFKLIDEGTRKRVHNTVNASCPTYNTRCIADSEISDNLLGKNYRDTDVVAHGINIGAPEYRLQWTTQKYLTTLAVCRGNRSALYGAINRVVRLWIRCCNKNNSYNFSCPTLDQCELYERLKCKKTSEWDMMDHWSLRPRQLRQCPVTTWNEMFASTALTNEYGYNMEKADVIDRMSTWCTRYFPDDATVQPPLIQRGMRDATFRLVKFRLQALRELQQR